MVTTNINKHNGISFLWSKIFKNSPILPKLEVKSTSLKDNFTSNFTSNFGHIGLFLKILDHK